MIIALLIIGLILCLAFSAFFSASEMSYSSCSELRLENLESVGDKKAKKALKIVHNFNDVLGSILIGNNLVNIAASSIGSVLVIEIFNNDNYAWVSTLVVTILVIIFGETIPKIIAKKKSTSFAIAFAGLNSFLMIIFKPLIKLFVFLVNLITKNMEGEDADKDEEDLIEEAIDELSSIVETAEDEDILDEDQSELVQAAIDFLDVSAVEAMTSRVDLVAIDIDDDIEEINRVINESQFTRIPVYEDSIDNIIGVLHVNHYLKACLEDINVNIKDILIQPCYVYKTTLLTSILDQLRKAQTHMAIVCDEYGGTLGIITMEDILEEIVGEIWDETDEIEEEEVKELTESIFELDGDLTISEFCELINIHEDDFECESETVGGWALEHFECYPKNYDTFIDENLKVTVIEIEDRRILKLLVELLPTTED